MGEREGAKEVKAHPAHGDRAVPRGGGSLCHQGCGGGDKGQSMLGQEEGAERWSPAGISFPPGGRR